jgi:hypothetical protein
VGDVFRYDRPMDLKPYYRVVINGDESSFKTNTDRIDVMLKPISASDKEDSKMAD